MRNVRKILIRENPCNGRDARLVRLDARDVVWNGLYPREILYDDQLRPWAVHRSLRTLALEWNW